MNIVRGRRCALFGRSLRPAPGVHNTAYRIGMFYSYIEHKDKRLYHIAYKESKIIMLLLNIT